MKYISKVRRKFSSYPVFTIRDVRIALKQDGISPLYTRQLVHYLVSRGELKRITRGAYTFYNESQLVEYAFTPSYHGLQDALSLHNFWEQETNPVIITPRKVRPGIRTFEGTNYLVRRISRQMFFGFETMKYGDFWTNVSTPEKTLIDFAYYGEFLGEETLKEIRKKLRPTLLKDYLAKCPADTAKTVRRWVRLNEQA